MTAAPTHSFGRAAGERSAAADLALLRTYEPIIRYTRGELFFPTAVGPYMAH